METAALLAPVTALEFLQDSHLLTGEGPVLTLYRLQPRPKACASLSVLQNHRIHGIRPRAAQSSGAHGEDKEGQSSYDLAVFGGKAVILLRLQDGDHLEAVGPLVQLQDWALDVCWLSGEGGPLVGVALAHNRALLLDVVKGEALVQSSCLEGCLLYSALLLLRGSWEDAVLVGGTVFNQLILWKPGAAGGGGGGGGGEHDSELKAPVQRRLLGHSGVIFSISYLQEKELLASASDDRSVRLWGVGVLGGAGGECGDVNPACLRVLYGHQARVFSVRLSPGRVFSAGEDGACLVWDQAGGGTVVRTLKGHRAGGVRSLAVSKTKEDRPRGARWVATGGADGGVRLWEVEEEEEEEEEEEGAVKETLTDLNFPGQGLPKVVCIAGDGDENPTWAQNRFIVCTDQGIVYQYSKGCWEIMWRGPTAFQSYCVMETVTVAVKDSAVAVDLCAVGNLSGDVQVFITARPQCGVALRGGGGKIHSLVWQNGGGGGSSSGTACLLASGAEGRVYRWSVEVRFDGNGLVLGVAPLTPFLLPPCAKRWLTAAVRLHSRTEGALWVCGDRRGSLLLFGERQITERKGDEGERDEGGGVTLQPLSFLFGVHGKQGVTSLSRHQRLLYSTGRDGCVRVLRVRRTPRPAPAEHRDQIVDRSNELQLEVLRVQRACRGMEWLERVLILEREVPEEEAELDEECDRLEMTWEEGVKGSSGGEAGLEGKEARFVIVGFHAVHFVVWDPVRQERLLAVPCGGGHRSWSLWPSRKGVWPGFGVVVFVKQGAVLASRPPREAATLAGVAGKPGGWGLREGVHGRGIGCVCRLGRIQGPGHVGRESWEVLVTGGEDTSVTVLAVEPDSGAVRVLSVITDHISSVRALAAAVERRAASGLSALVVSAGGRAQIQCYRLWAGWDGQNLGPACQVIQVAAHRLDAQWERKRNRHKTVKADPETRYMSVALMDGGTDGVLLSLACSDGAVRLFSLSEVKGHIDLLWESFHHQRCVLSVATCSLEDGQGNRYRLLFSAATDGKIAVWDVTTAPSSSSTSSSQSEAPPPPLPLLIVPAHQSGVNSLAVWWEKLGQQEGGCLVTVASGGDDGQLTVSTVRVQYPEREEGGSRGFSQTLEQRSDSQEEPQLPVQAQPLLSLQLQSQAHVPLAHAAPLTSLKLLTPGLLVSTSSDQRVCLWRLSSTGLSHRGALCSHVADAAGLAVWEVEGGGESGGAEGETGRRVGSAEGETADECEKPVEAARQTGDPVCKSGGEKGGETAGEPGDQREGEGETGWVLVCGQGLQLIRV
ncbi:tRNA (34-2'-O)-methyltransferase regulator WDR6 [Genypterus blacodes]|uniref:tRNA (34-2'-O)-methyltransferase regulator WDR6 n=1 Tax=Genypterus blacodes TaxID=154954 RepID=UPI003F76EDDA